MSFSAVTTALPACLALLIATVASAGFEVLEAHGLASAQIGTDPAILDEDWSMPLEVSAFLGGPTGMVAGTGATFNIGTGFTGNTSAQVNAFSASPMLAAGTLMDFSFVVDSDVSAALAIDMMLMSHGDAFGSVSVVIQDLTDDLTLLAWQQSSGQASIESMLDLQEGHEYQFVASSQAGIADGGTGSMSSKLFFQMLLPAPGAAALLTVALCIPRGRRRRR